MADQIASLAEWREHVAAIEAADPGFWKRHHARAMSRLHGGYQFGYEIEGYGTVVGHCTQHKPHQSEADAIECGRRFLAGKPPRLVDRMPWRRTKR